MKYLILFISITFFSCEYFESNPAKKVEIYSGAYYVLMDAAKHNDLGKMEKVVKENNLNLNYADFKYGVSLLNWCLINGKIESFEKLLQLGADPNWQDPRGEMAPPITEASAMTRNDFLNLCLKYKGNPNVISNDESAVYKTPLYGAVSAGNVNPREYLENIQTLIKVGADVNLVADSVHGSPLAEALIYNHIEQAEYLINHGADYKNLKSFTISGDTLDVIFLLRELDFPLDSYKYKVKLRVINFLLSKGLNYWKSPIPDDIKKNYTQDTSYLSKY